MKKITNELMCWLVLIIMIVIATFGMLNYFISINQLTMELDNRGEYIIGKISNDLVIPLLNLDKSSIQEISLKQKSELNIVMMKVTDNYNEVMFEQGSLTENKDYITKRKTVFYDENEIGYLEIALSKENIHFAQMTIIRSTILSIIVAILSIVIITKIIMSRVLDKPLKKLLEGAISVTEGNLNYRINLKKENEIGKLATTFDNMTASLQKSRKELEDYSETLEKKVEERTKELKSKNKELEKNRAAILNMMEDSKELINIMKKSEEKFKAVFEGATDGILAADVKTKKFVFANPKMCEITGYTEKELLELNVSRIHPKKDLSYVLDQFIKLAEEKITITKDIPILRKDKKVIYCDISGKVMKIGKQNLLVGFFRKVAEKEYPKA